MCSTGAPPWLAICIGTSTCSYWTTMFWLKCQTKSDGSLGHDYQGVSVFSKIIRSVRSTDLWVYTFPWPSWWKQIGLDWSIHWLFLCVCVCLHTHALASTRFRYRFRGYWINITWVKWTFCERIWWRTEERLWSYKQKNNKNITSHPETKTQTNTNFTDWVKYAQSYMSIIQ